MTTKQAKLDDERFTETSPEQFVASVRRMIDENPRMGAFLTVHDPDELADHTLLTAHNGDVGVAVSPDGDIQNLFNNDGPDGAGRAAFQTAIKNGGRTLDCYDGYLRDLYTSYGFRETGRIEFNPAYAPDGWDFEAFGQPDVVFMAYDPEDLNTAETDEYYDASEWGQAKADARRTADN